MHTKHLDRATPESGQLMPSYEMQVVETRTGTLIVHTETLEEAYEETRDAYEYGCVLWVDTEESFSFERELKAGN
jgi:hypothetical protein